MLKVLVILVSGCCAALSQDRLSPAIVSGAVYDLEWHPIGGAEVRLTNLESCSTTSVVTRDDGLYGFPDPGVHEFRINVSGPALDPIATTPFKVISREAQFRKHFLQPVTKSPLEVKVECPEAQLHGGRVQSATLKSKVTPKYPDSLRQQGISGEVVLEAVLDQQGRITTLRALSSPHPALTEAAERAVQKWRYNPTRLDGKPVEVVFPITVRFAQ